MSFLARLTEKNINRQGRMKRHIVASRSQFICRVASPLIIGLLSFENRPISYENVKLRKAVILRKKQQHLTIITTRQLDS